MFNVEQGEAKAADAKNNLRDAINSLDVSHEMKCKLHLLVAEALMAVMTQIAWTVANIATKEIKAAQ